MAALGLGRRSQTSDRLARSGWLVVTAGIAKRALLPRHFRRRWGTRRTLRVGTAGNDGQDCRRGEHCGQSSSLFHVESPLSAQESQ
jgi:hypothetical protein